MVVVCVLCLCGESGLRVLNSLHVLALPAPRYHCNLLRLCAEILNLCDCGIFVVPFTCRVLYFFNTLRTGAFKLFKCPFPGSKQFKSTFILRFFKYL